MVFPGIKRRGGLEKMYIDFPIWVGSWLAHGQLVKRSDRGVVTLPTNALRLKVCCNCMRLNLVCGGVLATVLKIKRHYAEVMPCVCRPVLILTVTESLLRSLQSIPNVTIRTVRLRYPGRVRLSERSQQSSGVKFEFFRHLGHYAP